MSFDNPHMTFPHICFRDLTCPDHENKYLAKYLKILKLMQEATSSRSNSSINKQFKQKSIFCGNDHASGMQ